MSSPFPGMDPYLEHPVLWEGVHARMVVAIANRLQPLLDPPYVATVEERVYIEGPQRRIPDVWIQHTNPKRKRGSPLSSLVDARRSLPLSSLTLRVSVGSDAR